MKIKKKLRKILKNKEAQFTLIALVMIFIMLIVFSIFLPIMNPYINDIVNNTNDPATATLVQLIPFFIVVAILLSIIYYIIPQR